MPWFLLKKFCCVCCISNPYDIYPISLNVLNMFLKIDRLIEAQHHFLSLSVQFAHMWFVGLLGGAMYVNTFYSVMADHNIASDDKEMCVNLVSISSFLHPHHPHFHTFSSLLLSSLFLLLSFHRGQLSVYHLPYSIPAMGNRKVWSL